MSSMKVMALFICVVMAVGCGGNCASTPQEMFEFSILKPVPAGVTDIQGVGDAWQGLNIYLRFSATDEALTKILGEHAQSIDWNTIKKDFELPIGWDEFEPNWSPESVETKECYKIKVKDEIGKRQDNWFVVDRKRHVVYAWVDGT